MKELNDILKHLCFNFKQQ